MKRKLILLFVILISASSVLAGLRLPQLFQNGMVLQRGVDIPVWGWADVGQRVTVTFADDRGRVLSSATATAGADGRWRVDLLRPAGHTV